MAGKQIVDVTDFEIKPVDSSENMTILYTKGGSKKTVDLMNCVMIAGVIVKLKYVSCEFTKESM